MERVRAERGDGSERSRHESDMSTEIQMLDHKTVDTGLLQAYRVRLAVLYSTVVRKGSAEVVSPVVVLRLREHKVRMVVLVKH